MYRYDGTQIKAGLTVQDPSCPLGIASLKAAATYIKYNITTMAPLEKPRIKCNDPVGISCSRMLEFK